MIERIKDIADGIFDMDGFGAGCSVDRVDDTINAGEKKSCTFFVVKEDGSPVKGVVYSSDHRVKVNTEAFLGHNCRIEYEIDASELRNGDVIEGNFSIITNCGEMYIPYCISVIYGHGDIINDVRTLESFSEFARDNWETASKLCESAEFLSLPFMDNAGYIALYQALCTNVEKDNLLEEFLVGTGMKSPITISGVDMSQSYVRSEVRTSDYISIRRNTWGFVQLKVGTDSDFIILAKDTITSDDFIDDIYTLEYKIDMGRLHSGLNCGKVIFESVRQRCVININISANGAERDKKSAAYKRLLVQSMRHYVDYCTRIEESEKYLNLLKSDFYDMASLEQKNPRIVLAVAWYNIMKGYTEDAENTLNRIRGTIVDEKTTISAEYCIYYYLCYLLGNGTANLDTLLRLIHRCYDETKDLVLFQIMLSVDAFWNNDPVKKLAAVKRKFMEGCYAPWLYIEACKIYIDNPKNIVRLGSFELNCLWFGAKQGIISAELADYVSTFAGSVTREHNKSFLKILTKLYETHDSTSVLKAICNILLKEDTRLPEYFKWYARGIERDFRLTRLYEYYIYSMPKDFDEPIPKKVLMYFSYTNTLDVPSRITIYRNIVKHYSFDDQIRAGYAGQIESFVVDQLLKGYIDEGMTELYNDILYEDMIDSHIAKPLTKMLYAARFTSANKKIRKIVICYKELNKQQVLVPWNGVAYAVLLSDNFVVVGEDAEGRRYVELNIKIKNVFENKSLVQACKKVEPEQELIKIRDNLELIERSNRGEIKVYDMLELLQNSSIRDIYKVDIVTKLAQYCSNRADLVPEAMLNIDKSLISAGDREIFLEMLMSHERYQRAFELMSIYGWEYISDRSLVDTTSRMIVEYRFDKNTILVNMARDCFLRGCFNQRILEYLLCNYNGDSQTMLEILRVAASGGCKRFDFSERILSQLIFTGDYKQLDEVFDVYFKENQKDETLVQAYLAIRSRDYLNNDENVPAGVFEVTEQFVRAGRRLTDVTKIALCKYYSALSELSDDQKNICYRYINAYYRRDIVFSFYQKLGRFIKLPDNLEDKIIIEYRAEKDSSVKLRSRILPDNTGWSEEVLIHMMEGFFVKVITLLRGEVLEYEVMCNGETAVAGQISLDDDSAGLIGEGRNTMINRMLDAKERNDLGRVVLNAQNYALYSTITEKLLTLL